MTAEQLTKLRALQREWVAGRRRFVQAVKITEGCVDCGTHEGRRP